MPLTVAIHDVAPRRIAVVRGSATAANLPQRIRALFNEFYASFKGKGGLNLVFYPSWDPREDFEIECGVLMETGGNSSLPAGEIVTTAYYGAYEQLKVAHDAIHRFVRDNGHQLAGPSWEIYGHWNNDPSKLRTDIYYLLAPVRPQEPGHP